MQCHTHTQFSFFYFLWFTARVHNHPHALLLWFCLHPIFNEWITNSKINSRIFFFCSTVLFNSPFWSCVFFIFLLFRRLLFFPSQSILTGEKKMVYGVYFAVKTRILIAGLYPSMLFISHRCWFHLFCNSKVFSLCTLHFILFFSLRFSTFSFIYLCSVVLNLFL